MSKPEVTTDSLGGTCEKHESYGQLRFSRRTNSGGQNLYGSSIRHSNTICLTISRSSKNRNLHYDRFFPEEEIVEVEMSPAQFADAISSFNIHSGPPCTIKYVGRKRMDECPEYSQRQVFDDELSEDIRNITANAAKLAEEASNILHQKTILKPDREKLLELLRKLMQDVQCNLPFIHTQFNEAMDNTVTEAKGEVEAFFSNVVHCLGIDALKDKIQANEFVLRAPVIDAKRIENGV